MTKRMLIVDDEPDIRLLVRMQVQALGFDVVGEAADGQQAIDQARELDPEVIVLDVMMPGMTGLEALPTIREACPDAFVVIYSVFAPGAEGSELANSWVRKGGALDALSDAIGG